MRYTTENTVMVGLMAHVFLNGEPVRECIEADDRLGFVVVVSRDAAGGEELRLGAVSVTLEPHKLSQ